MFLSIASNIPPYSLCSQIKIQYKNHTHAYLWNTCMQMHWAHAVTNHSNQQIFIELQWWQPRATGYYGRSKRNV